MGKIIIEGSSVAEVIALALSMQGGGTVHNTTVMHGAAALASGEDGPEETGPVNAAAPAFDAAGLPWDERIHSSTKDLNGDGKWRARRKSKGQPDDATVAAVEAELRARVGGQQQPMQMQPVQQQQPMQQMQPVMQQMQPVVQQQPMQMQTQPQQMVQQQPVMQQQPMQMQPVQQQQPMQQMQTQEPLDFGGFMKTLAQGFNVARPDGSALVDQNYMAQLAVHFGLTAITDLSMRTDLIPNVVAQVRADGRWLGA